VLGVIEDVAWRTPVGFSAEGDSVYLLGETRDELAGSAWADVLHDHLGGLPPIVDLEHEHRLATLLVRASRQGLLSSAHDLADGGLAQALVESSLRRGFGVEVTLPPDVDPFVALFSESAGRVLVSLPAADVAELVSLCAEHDIPLTSLGQVSAGEVAELSVTGQFSVPLRRIREAWSATLPRVLANH